MASLVQFLAAGANGAASGTATFYLRGSVSSAASVLYNDFEEISQPGTNVIPLDANGSAEVYCDAYVDVEIRNSAGTTLRTVTLGHSAPVVEVESTSFTGTDYDGAPANTIGEPITLKAVLDKWILSAGAPDWQVIVDGNPVNLSTAVSSFSGMFINVKDPQFGAIGDGVTNDTVAITNAIAAADDAGGGVIVFPPGTYLTGSISTSVDNIALLGFGQATIRFNSSGNLTFTDDTIDALKHIKGFRFETSGTPDRFLNFGAGGQNVVIEDCVFDTDGTTDEVILFDGASGTYYINRCRFLVSTTQSNAALNHAGGANKNIYVSDCFFLMPASYAGTCIRGSCFNVTECVFDGTATSTGAFVCVDAQDPDDLTFFAGRVSGCEFYSGDPSVIQCIRLDNVGAESSFIESDNFFSTATEPYAYANNASIDEDTVVLLHSRIGRQFSVTTALTSLSPSAPLPYSKLIVHNTNTGNFTLTFSGTNRPPALDWDAVVLNDSASPHDITFAGTGQSVTIAAVPAGGRATAHFFTYVEAAGTVAVGITGTLTGAT